MCLPLFGVLASCSSDSRVMFVIVPVSRLTRPHHHQRIKFLGPERKIPLQRLHADHRNGALSAICASEVFLLKIHFFFLISPPTMCLRLCHGQVNTTYYEQQCSAYDTLPMHIRWWATRNHKELRPGLSLPPPQTHVQRARLKEAGSTLSQNQKRPLRTQRFDTPSPYPEKVFAQRTESDYFDA